MSSDADTGPGDGEGNNDEDISYGVGQPPASPMEVDPPALEGEPSGNKTSEEWQVVSEMRADSAAATLVGLVMYSASSDDGFGEEEGGGRTKEKEFGREEEGGRGLRRRQ